MGYDLGDVCDKLDDVCGRLDDVESAVKANKPDWQLGGWATFGLLMIIFVWIPALVSGAVHSKVRYYLAYPVEYNDIYISDKPHDCAFLKAPLGDKECHYERDVEFYEPSVYDPKSALYVHWTKVDD